VRHFSSARVMSNSMGGLMNRLFPRWSLLLAALVPALSACGPQAGSSPPSTAEQLQPQSPARAVSALDIGIGSALGSPVASAFSCSQTNQSAPACAYSGASDQAYLWTAPYAGTFTFNTLGASYDTVLHIYDRANGTALGCNDDDQGTLQSSITLSLNAGQSLRIVVDGYAWACGSFVLNVSSRSGAPVRRAMTWSLLSSAAPNATQAYALVGSDATTNPYSGDTLTSQALPVLCINKSGLANPGTSVIGSPSQTPGGASRRTWSGGIAALTAPVLGTSLTSLSAANTLCANQFGAGYRMAEFHDGDPNLWSGWDFWAEARGGNLAPFRNTRFWVFINDQDANPW